jgi:Predicted metal-dependent hydrolase of the TIM-barrel fold
LVLAGSREGWACRHVSCGRRGSQVRPHRGAPPAAHAHHRPHGLELIEPYQQDHREIPAAIDQAIALAKYPNVSIKLSGALGNSLEPYPFRDMTVYLQRLFDAYGPQRCYWGTDITNSFAAASYRQRVTHFTEELSFLSESDKDWVMGRAILARLKWA